MTVTDEAIDKIKEMIVGGQLRPGDRLPRGADLAKRLGLSRNSLREAVKALCLVRVLEVRHGDGTFVSTLDPAVLRETVSFVVDVHRGDTDAAFLEVRRILEPAAAGLAAQRITEAELVALRAVVDALPACPTVDEAVANGDEFHRRIARCAGNEVLDALIEGFSGRGAACARRPLSGGAVTRMRDEHAAILDAIASGRPALASAWSTVHIAPATDAHRPVLASGTSRGSASGVTAAGCPVAADR